MAALTALVLSGAAVRAADYEVTVVSGDPSYAQGPHRVIVDDVTAIDDVPTDAMSFVEGTVQVPVRTRSRAVTWTVTGS